MWGTSSSWARTPWQVAHLYVQGPWRAGDRHGYSARVLFDRAHRPPPCEGGRGGLRCRRSSHGSEEVGLSSSEVATCTSVQVCGLYSRHCSPVTSSHTCMLVCVGTQDCWLLPVVSQRVHRH
jgi:hypothetical protein